MLIRVLLSVFFCAFTILTASLLLDDLGLMAFSNSVADLGALILNSSIGLVFIIAIAHIAKHSLITFMEFFSKGQRVQRRYLFYSQRIKNIDRLHRLQKQRMIFFNRLRRHRIQRKFERS